MRRAELEPVIRAAADVAGDTEIVVIGSQAILAESPDAPRPLVMSQEADVYPRNQPAKAVDVDGALGDGSDFHATFGYYAHGVGPETAKAPAGWETRLVRIRIAGRGRGPAVTGWCMEAHDIVLAKCAAGRERDWDFAEQAIRHGVVSGDELLRRVPDLPLTARARARVRKMLDGIVVRAGRAR